MVEKARKVKKKKIHDQAQNLQFKYEERTKQIFSSTHTYIRCT